MYSVDLSSYFAACGLLGFPVTPNVWRNHIGNWHREFGNSIIITFSAIFQKICDFAHIGGENKQKYPGLKQKLKGSPFKKEHRTSKYADDTTLYTKPNKKSRG